MKDSIQHTIFKVNTQNNQNGQISRLLTYTQLKTLKGISFSRQHIDRLEKDGKFPHRFQLSPGKSARKFWWEHEIDKWLAKKGYHSRLVLAST